jgi:hypothetical protein
LNSLNYELKMIFISSFHTVTKHTNKCTLAGSDVNPNLLCKMEVFLKRRMCSRSLCIRKGSHSFTFLYANGCQVSYFKFENVKQDYQKVICWDVPKKALDEHVVHCKRFQNIGLHNKKVKTKLQPQPSSPPYLCM